MTVTLTEVAELRLRTFLYATQKENSASQPGFRISVKDGGCSGYEYALDIAKTPRETDLQYEIGKIQVYIDPDSAPLLNGVVIDYVEGLTQSGFKFSNPNATETCGCGQSFKVGECTPSAVPCTS